MECTCICTCSGTCRCCGHVKFRGMFPVGLPGEIVPFETRSDAVVDAEWDMALREAEAARQVRRGGP